MQLTHNQNATQNQFFAVLKSFSIWCFALTVCFLVVGFPVVAVMTAIACLLAIALQSILPMSAVLLVASSVIGFNLLAIILTSAGLTLKGIHPQDVSWLRWLHGKSILKQTAKFAACPITCNLIQE
ncbi:hypothetical protein FRE64_08375 [Euhalothece natronophila Z-M001]|uniref:Uncharacterized protein n=1 Tax=Euhalothece natronophila Z-M001 TaxID=522448 RepID=A0A5B8NLY9_9CHRO|nr:hypothetical protein [Euhalothece natronophila]QDZ39957.1 hypothetical protein FRE64_08375 [Euhalothece natronophila Z-M001]